MDKFDAAGLAMDKAATSGELHQVTAELTNIAAAVDRLGEVSHPPAELLEASHAIHRALVFLSNSSAAWPLT
jgi:hypothetical protein